MPWPVDTVVRITLTPVEGSTRVDVEHRGFQEPPSTLGFDLAEYGMGWRAAVGALRQLVGHTGGAGARGSLVGKGKGGRRRCQYSCQYMRPDLRITGDHRILHDAPQMASWRDLS